MKVSDFDYDLSPEAIAQEPCRPRDASRLLAMDRKDGRLEHRRFRDLPALLRPGDLVVFNDTRVIPARLDGRKPTGGSVEVLLTRRLSEEAGGEDWECLLRASRNPAPGTVLRLDGGLSARVLKREGETWAIRLEHPSERPMERVLEAGRMPLPPYIRRREGDGRHQADRLDYQTVYARSPGAVAAPTAGLHFTPAVLEALGDSGIRTAHVTLHVGIGTFLPVRVNRAEDHVMHAERFEIPPATSEAVALARTEGGRIIAVGTTVVRTLEGAADPEGMVAAGSGECDLFILPGYRFRVVDGLVTNFHLPGSTLMMLVSAFAGRERILRAYRIALEAGYRFYSYGDAMFLR